MRGERWARRIYRELWDGPEGTLKQGEATQPRLLRRVLGIGEIPEMFSDDDECHELAHWLCASRSRRNARDGLMGLEPWGSSHLEHEEELRASLLGILLERSVGIDYHATLRFHSWDEDDDNAPRTLIALRRLGLIDSDGRPTIRLDLLPESPK